MDGYELRQGRLDVVATAMGTLTLEAHEPFPYRISPASASALLNAVPTRALDKPPWDAGPADLAREFGSWTA